MFRHACAMGLEGIVSKKLTSRYKSGRCASWLKVKNPALAAVVRNRLRARAVAHAHGRHRVGALLRLGAVEADRLPLRPGGHRVARRLGEEAMAREHVLQPLG